MTAATDEASALEADALEHPAQRGEILLEAARAWHRAGHPDRATELITDVVAAGGEDGCYARVELADLRFATDRADDARAELSALARDPHLHDGHCMLVAELLAERAELAESLRWYDRLVARLTPDRIAALGGPHGWMSMDSVPLRGRQHVREQLGLTPDATDQLVPTAPGRNPFGPPTSVEEMRDRLDDGGAAPKKLRMLTFQRGERAVARRRWPDEYDTTDEEHYPAAELRWRELAERGVPTIQVVPIVVDELVAYAERVGGSPLDPAVKTRFLGTVPEQRMISWPPPRNAPCWCGSGSKYKRCCGRADRQ